MKMHTELVFWAIFKPDLDKRDATELRYTSVWILDMWRNIGSPRSLALVHLM